MTQVVRDWRTLALALVLPVPLLILLSAGLSLRVDDLPIVVQDFSVSPASQEFLDAFRASISFHIEPWPVARRPEEALTSGVARAVLIVPTHFGRDVARGVDTVVQFLVDASDANTAKLAAGYADQITRAYNQRPPLPSAPDQSRRRFASGTTPGSRRRSSMAQASLC